MVHIVQNEQCKPPNEGGEYRKHGITTFDIWSTRNCPSANNTPTDKAALMDSGIESCENQQGDEDQ